MYEATGIKLDLTGKRVYFSSLEQDDAPRCAPEVCGGRSLFVAKTMHAKTEREVRRPQGPAAPLGEFENQSPEKYLAETDSRFMQFGHHASWRDKGRLP